MGPMNTRKQKNFGCFEKKITNMFPTKRDSFLVPERPKNTFGDQGGRGSGPWGSSQSKTFGFGFEPEM